MAATTVTLPLSFANAANDVLMFRTGWRREDRGSFGGIYAKLNRTEQFKTRFRYSKVYARLKSNYLELFDIPESTR